MLVTIILDAYEKSKKAEIAEAVENIVYYDSFASAGIYCYWDYYTNEMLYLGLTNDLLHRFKQHNGLIKCHSNSCKVKNINTYFKDKKKLGYSMILQSCLVQVPSSGFMKRSQRKINHANIYYENMLDYNAIKAIKIMESLNLEAVKALTGFLPKWNLIKGSSETKKNYGTEYSKWINEYLEFAGLLCNRTSNLNVARSSLRELNSNVDYRIIERFLHGVRMNILPFKEALDFFRYLGGFNDVIELIKTMKYLDKKPIL